MMTTPLVGAAGIVVISARLGGIVSLQQLSMLKREDNHDQKSHKQVDVPKR